MVLYTPGRTTTYPEEPVGSGIRIHFLGGGDEVGNVGVVIESVDGTRALIDYGIAPSSPPRYPREAPPIDDVILTHAHIDHIGMAPWMVAAHRARLHSTPLTAALCPMMWADTYKISQIEKNPLPWDRRDLEDAELAAEVHGFGEEFSIGSWKCNFHRAGHVPGAAMVDIQTASHRILHTGDLDTRDSPSALGASPQSCDILLMEATYADQDHPDRASEEARFIAKVVEVVERGGTVLVPAFASGRGQDILQMLWRSGLDLNIHYDGMGKRVSRKWLEHPDFLRDAATFETAFRATKRVSSKSDRKKALGADVIVTTSGMLNGGPAVWYLNRLRNDSRNAVLLTGYQAEDSGGHMLQTTGELSIFGTITPVPLEVERFHFSTHAGASELLEFAKACEPKHIVLFHADPAGRPALAERLKSETGAEVHLPVNGAPIHIE